MISSRCWPIFLLGLVCATASAREKTAWAPECVLFASADAKPGNKRIENADQLLAAVNRGLVTLHLPTFSADQLAICLAEQASLGAGAHSVSPGVQAFLQQLVSHQKFGRPIEVVAWTTDKVRMAGMNTLRVAPHYRVEVHLLNVPRGTQDAEGKDLKVVWDTIVVSYGLIH